MARQMSKQKIKTQRRLAAIVTAVLFSLLGAIAPAFHAHEDLGGSTCIPQVSVPSHNSMARSVVGGSVARLRVPITVADDQCALCQWLITGTYVTPEGFGLLLLALSAWALLTITARLSALCARPTPHRGLRAPPLRLIAA